MPEDAIEDILAEKLDYCRLWLEDKQTLSQCFLTEAACLAHIQNDKHNLHKPISFLSGLSKNPEMEQLMAFLCELSGGKLHT
jgi:hypothetical protein